MLMQQGFTDMLRDEDRNSKYYVSIKHAISAKHNAGEKAIVLDIGTGTGLLALMAVNMGADEVYACEMCEAMANCAEKIIRSNKCCNKIKLFKNESTDLHIGPGGLRRKANILVTEIFATSLLVEEAIRTFNHARRVLLTDDCIVIPHKAVMYAQVIDCPHFEQLSFIKSVNLPNGSVVKFPKSMECCDYTNTDFDVQLDALKNHQFKKLSSALKVFEFNWSAPVALEDQTISEFTISQDGRANTICGWWELELEDSNNSEDKKNTTISLRPVWAGGAGLWRFHWAQTVHIGFTPMTFKEGAQCYLQTFRDDLDIWYKLVKDAKNPRTGQVPQKKACYCNVHSLLNPCRISTFNQTEEIMKYANVISSIINLGIKTCICLSEPSGSILYLLAAKLGVRKVFVIQSESQRPDPTAHLGLQSLIAENNVKDVIKLLSSHPSLISSSDIGQDQIDFVIGDPYFGKLADGSGVLQMVRNGEHLPSDYPWHHLLFGHYLDAMRQKGLIQSGAKILPYKAVLKGIAVKFDNLHKINAPLSKVFDDMFDFQHYNHVIQGKDIRKGRIDHQFLWQYPGLATSSPFEIMLFDFNNPLKSQTCEGLVQLDEITNAVALWVEWWLTEDVKVSPAGPISSVKGQPIKWEMHSEQGVYYIWENFCDVVRYNVGFNRETCTLQFQFSDPAAV